MKIKSIKRKQNQFLIEKGRNLRGKIEGSGGENGESG